MVNTTDSLSRKRTQDRVRSSYQHKFALSAWAGLRKKHCFRLWIRRIRSSVRRKLRSPYFRSSQSGPQFLSNKNHKLISNSDTRTISINNRNNPSSIRPSINVHNRYSSISLRMLRYGLLTCLYRTSLAKRGRLNNRAAMSHFLIRTFSSTFKTFLKKKLQKRLSFQSFLHFRTFNIRKTFRKWLEKVVIARNNGKKMYLLSLYREKKMLLCKGDVLLGWVSALRFKRRCLKIEEAIALKSKSLRKRRLFTRFLLTYCLGY